MPQSCFFFSYARENRKNADRERPDGSTYNLVDQLFDHLCKSVSDITGMSRQKVGYRDLSALHVGAAWPQDLVEAIQASSVLIALITPHYLFSLNCGREFEAFARRYERLKNTSGLNNLASPLIPVFWMNADDCWPYATRKARQFLDSLSLTGPGLPDDYPSVGLFRQRVLGKPEAYERICLYLAHRIKHLAERQPALPALDEIADFRELSSAFDANQENDKPVEQTPTRVLYLNTMPGAPAVAVGLKPPAIQLTP